MTSWLAELDGRRVTVEVPATTANLGAGYDCLAMALELTNRVGLEVRTWSRGGIELVVEGEGAGELPADGRNRFVQGVEAAIREARGETARGRQLADRDGQQDPARARPRIQRRRDRSAASLPRTRCSATRSPRPTSSASRRGSRGTRTTPPRRSSAGSSSSAAIGDDRRGHPVRRPARPPRRHLHPGAPARHERDAARPPGQGPARGRGREPGAGGDRRRRDRHGPAGRAPAADRGPAPRAVPGGRLSAAAAPRRGRARGRGARCAA